MKIAKKMDFRAKIYVARGDGGQMADSVRITVEVAYSVSLGRIFGIF